MPTTRKTHFVQTDGKTRCGIDASQATKMADEVTCGHCRNHLRKVGPQRRKKARP
jgi:hypothetical protein